MTDFSEYQRRARELADVTLRITVWDRYVDLDRKGVAGLGHYLSGRFRVFGLEIER